METKKCVDCTLDIPKSAKRCPHCTTVQPVKSNAGALLVVILGVIVVFGVVLCAMPKPSRPPPTDGKWVMRDMAGARIMQQWARGYPRGAKSTPVVSLACRVGGGYLASVSDSTSKRDLEAAEVDGITGGHTVSLPLGDHDPAPTFTGYGAAMRLCVP